MADKPGFNFDSEGAWIAKDPNARKDYTIDFTSWLKNGDTLASVVFTVPAGLVKHSEGVTPNTAYVTISGGVLGANYNINAHIVTAQAREEDKSFRMIIREA